MKHKLRSPLLRRFRRDQHGLACLEFAMCLPFLLMMLMGSIEMTRFILVAQKVEKTAVTIADVVSQGETISNSELSNIIFASSQVMKPYVFGAQGYVIITSVTQTGAYSAANPPRVNWQYRSSGVNGSWTNASRIGTVGSVATLPPDFTLNDKDNIIITEVFYNFRPLMTDNGLVDNAPIYKTGLYKPRLGALTTLSALQFMLPSRKGAVL